MNLLTLFTLHLGISIFISFLTWLFLIRKTNRKKLLNFISIFSITTLLPLIGYILTPIYFLGLLNIKKQKSIKVNKIPTQDIIMERIKINKRQLGEAAITTIIREKWKLNERIISAIKEIINPLAIKATQMAISNAKDEETRLFAFSVIKSLEEKIEEQISLLKRYLNRNSNDKEKKAEILFNIAHLYWDLVYLNLIDTALVPFTINEAIKYAKEAIDIINKPEYHLLLGRIYLYLYSLEPTENYQKNAEKHLLNAFKYGDNITKNKTAPYLAEIAYLNKNFSTIKELFKTIKTPLHPETFFMKLFWVGTDDISKHR